MGISDKVDICNLAATHLNEKLITNIDSPSTKFEVQCSLLYDPVRRYLLRSYNWSFARKRIAIAADTESPAFGWSYQSNDMPSDFLKLISLNTSEGKPYINTNNKYYELEGKKILTNIAAPYYIIYIRDITTTSQFEDTFIMAFSFLLALVIAKSVGSSESTITRVTNDYEKMWKPTALSVSGTENPPVIVLSSDYVNIRRSLKGSSINESLVDLDEEVL